MNDTEDNHLIFEPKAWTKATIKEYSIEEEELVQRQQLENSLLEKQIIWRDKALENLKADNNLYQELLETKKVEKYLWNAVKEATLEALSGILHRYSPEETEEMIAGMLMTPNDDHPFRFGRIEEETESIHSFQNLMRGRILPDGVYTGKITNVSLEVIEDENDRNYGKKIFVFDIEIAEGQFTGKTAKIPLILNPYFLDMKMGRETEKGQEQGRIDYYKKLLKTFRKLGVVITDSSEVMTAQIAHVVGNTISFTVSQNGKKAIIDKLIERTKTFDEMLELNDLPDGNDVPFGD